VADELNRQVLCLPSSASLSVADQTRVIALIAGSASA
jgi:dTDP-4-amino-4,6-dideoxygalactose transaminase